MPLKHSVFTVMTPEYDLRETVELLSRIGYEGVEWRVHTVPSEFPSPPDFWRSNKSTVDIQTIVERAAEVRKLTEDYGLQVMALGTYLNYEMVDDLDRCMEAAKIMGAGSIRVGVPQYDGSVNYNDLIDVATEGYVKIEELARKHKIRANVEIHPHNICSSPSLAYVLVSNFDPDLIGVIYDPGNMVTEGNENWQLGLELLGPYLSHVHVKNAAWTCEPNEAGDRVWKTAQVPLDQGCVNWRDLILALDRVGYAGWVSLEDFAPGDTKAKLAQGLAYLKSVEKELGI